MKGINDIINEASEKNIIENFEDAQYLSITSYYDRSAGLGKFKTFNSFEELTDYYDYINKRTLNRLKTGAPGTFVFYRQDYTTFIKLK